MFNRRSRYLTLSLLILFSLTGLKEARANVALGAFGSWGSLKDSNAAIQSVRSTSIGGYLLPSLSIFPLLSLGLYGEYHSVGQLTAPTSVGGNNKSFSGYLGGGAVVISAAIFRLTAAYTFQGKGTLKKKTSLGLETTMEDPKGIHLILGISVFPEVSLDFGYTGVKYNVLVGGVSSLQTRDWEDYRLGASLNF